MEKKEKCLKELEQGVKELESLIKIYMDLEKEKNEQKIPLCEAIKEHHKRNIDLLMHSLSKMVENVSEIGVEDGLYEESAYHKVCEFDITKKTNDFSFIE